MICYLCWTDSISVLLLLDLSAVVETVDHKILKNRLMKHYVISGVSTVETILSRKISIYALNYFLCRALLSMKSTCNDRGTFLNFIVPVIMTIKFLI